MPLPTRSETSPLPQAPLAPAPTPSTGRHASRRPAVQRVPGWWRDACTVFTWSVLLYVTGLWVSNGGLQTTASSVAGFFDSTGRLTGLIASALLLLQVLMMARIPFAEKAFGQDELARQHRLIGFTSFNLMLAHIVLITIGYAADAGAGIVSTFVDMVLDEPGMLLALAGTVALVMVVVTSLKKARGKLRYESWHLIHLYGYLGAGLALPHQLWTGADFVSSPFATVFWWGLWIACVVAVLAFRVALPLWRSNRHQLTVAAVEQPAPGVTTVTVTGRDLGRLKVNAGQFFQWRFLSGEGKSRAHPYSLSHAPDGRSLKVTVAHLGEGSAATASLRPGTKVMIEGPYGRLHEGVRTQRKVLLLGAGIGITPLRALLEGMDLANGEATMIYRAHSDADILWREELTDLAAARGARLFFVPGARMPGRDSWLPAAAGDIDDGAALRQLVPDIAEHDVYLCGATAWMDAARQAARSAGVPDDHIHLERFAY